MGVYKDGKITSKESFLEFYTHLYGKSDSLQVGMDQYIKQADIPKFTRG